MRTLDYLVLGAAGVFTIVYVLPMFNDVVSYATAADELATIPTRPTKGKAPTGGSSGAGSNTVSQAAWSCITHRERLKVLKDPATVTGTVLGVSGGPHSPADGDLVFSLKLDPPYASMVNKQNNLAHYAGGLWIEAVCQGPNKATEARHQGDCKCNAPRFTKPKVGDHLKITGAHCTDVGEEGHNEIHPVYTMEKI
jgi:hypothetical protein